VKSQYPEIKVVDDLCDMLGLSTERISIWFQNRRARFKKARKLQAQSTGYATVPSKSSDSNEYNYTPTNSAYANLYAGQPQIYSEQFSMQKVDSYPLTTYPPNVSKLVPVQENNENIVNNSTQGQAVLNQQFYPQK
jgi:hypothetical protein